MNIKTIFLAILLAFTFLTPKVEAQVVSPATTADVEALKSTLIALLTQMIAQLQEQINAILTQQRETQQSVNQLQVNSPVLGVAQKEVFKISDFLFEDADDGSVTRFRFTSNKSVDMSQTELWVNGKQVDATFTSRVDGSIYRVTMTPSLPSLTVADQYGTRKIGSVVFKFHSTNGDTLVSTDEVFTYINAYSHPVFGQFSN